jgi:hypothetical protein
MCGLRSNDFPDEEAGRQDLTILQGVKNLPGSDPDVFIPLSIWRDGGQDVIPVLHKATALT